MAKSNTLGTWGETIAAEVLRRKGFAVIEKNYRSRYGEIDLIAEGQGMVVFAEVKLRKTALYGAAREFVNARKQERIKNTALLWLSEHETAAQPRFDVIEVYPPDGKTNFRPRVCHLEDAF